MTTLITGYRGFIGSRMIEDNLGIDSLNLAKVRNSIDSLAEPDIKIRTIYHLGALSGIAECEKDQLSAIKMNVESTKLYLDLALEKGSDFIFASSVAAANPHLNYYAKTKAIGEDLCKAYRERGLNVNIYRFPNIYGPGSYNKTSVVANMFRNAIVHGYIDVYGDGQQERNLLYIYDLVSYLKSNLIENIDVTLCTSSRKKIIDLARIIAEMTGAHIVFTGGQGGVETAEVDWPSLNIEKTALRDGLKNTYEYFKEMCL